MCNYTTVAASPWTALNWGPRAADFFLGKTVGRTSSPGPIDLRANRDWWTVSDQGSDASCVGFAVAEDLVRFLLVENEVPDFSRTDHLSARFLWMAAKETDIMHEYPTTFMEREGTRIKNALHFVYKHGCLKEVDFPYKDHVTDKSRKFLTESAEKNKISGYFNLCWPAVGPNHVKALNEHLLINWLHTVGPIVLRIYRDRTWYDQNTGILTEYNDPQFDVSNFHAVTLVGYDKEGHWIIRNTEGRDWGIDGHTRCTSAYLKCIIREAYGAILKFQKDDLEKKITRTFYAHELESLIRYCYE